MPPSTENANTGIWPEKPTRPSSAEEPVRLYTSQDCATFCIQVPTRLMNWPPKKSWKFLYLSARSVTGKFMRKRSFQYTGRRETARAAEVSYFTGLSDRVRQVPYQGMLVQQVPRINYRRLFPKKSHML